MSSTRRNLTIEQLWEQFCGDRVGDPRLRLKDFAKRHPNQADDILRVFPMMLELDSFAASEACDSLNHKLPESIGGYPIVRQLGAGSMGVVYEAQCEALRERIAIKAMSPDRIDSKHVKRFENEARSVARLHHENIVPIYEFGVDGSRSFYTMRLIEGPNLSSVLHAAIDQPSQDAFQIPAEEELNAHQKANLLRGNWCLLSEIGLQATAALSHAHNNGVFHRDIKPGNLILDDRNHLWITDFGLAKQVLADTSLTSMYQAVGTPRYMAPEQIQGISDGRSDLYSLGLSLCELAIMRRLERDEIVLLASGYDAVLMQSEVPAELRRILTKAVSANSEQRYQTAAEMQRDLEQVASKARSINQRKRKRLAGAMLASYCTLVAMLGLLGMNKPVAPAEPPTLSLSVIEGQQTIAIDAILKSETSTLATSELCGPDAAVFKVSRDERALQFSKPPDYEVPDDRNLDNVYQLRLRDREVSITVENRNEPPAFDEFAFQTDGKTILLPRQRFGDAWALDIDDDSDSLFDGLCVTVCGGSDQNRINMSPQGIFALDQRVRSDPRCDANSDGVFEFEVSVNDRSSVVFARLERSPKGTICLVRERVLAGGLLSRHVVSENCLLQRDIIDIASGDGQTFYHIHRQPDGKVSLFRSQLTDGAFSTSKLAADCGLPSNTVALATRDGVHFVHLAKGIGNLQPVALTESVLNEEGQFEATRRLEDCRLPRTLEALSWLDTRRFGHVRRELDGKRSMSLSFLGETRFSTMPLVDAGDHEPTERCYGQAAWIERADDSLSVRRTIYLTTPGNQPEER